MIPKNEGDKHHFSVIHTVLNVDKDGDADTSAAAGEVISSRARWLILALQCPEDPDHDTSKA
jgi:hypothetical protein